MVTPTKVVDIELSQPLQDISDLAGYGAVRVIFRLDGTPIGCADLPVYGRTCPAAAIQAALCQEPAIALVHEFLRRGLAGAPPPAGLTAEALFRLPAPPLAAPWPLVTVAVCTRGRTADLRHCLQALRQLDYPHLDLLVVDNAPPDDSTRQLVERAFAPVRYLCERRPGLNWARNCAIRHARGEIVAFTDDDVIVDPGWVRALVQPFLADPAVTAVTGLVVPFELETEAQLLFERYGGFGRGFRRGWFRVNPQDDREWEYRGTGRFGTGANMAFRRAAFDAIGLFDPALDVGTVTNGGGDLEMFYRVLKEGGTLVYEPAALVRHRHRRTYAQLRTQLTNNGIGFYAYLVRSAWAYPEERRNFWRLGFWWLWWWYLRRLLLSYQRPALLPRELIWTELRGMLVGLGRYPRARRQAKILAAASGETLPAMARRRAARRARDRGPTAVHHVDLSQPLQPIAGIASYARVRVFVTWGERPLGDLTLINAYKPVSVPHLRDALVDAFSTRLLANPELADGPAALEQLIRARFPLAPAAAVPAAGGGVSIVVATYDRPADLQACLQSLLAQQLDQPVEIIVVDNHPASGQTAPVVAQFPGVRLVGETRQGLSYARNAGILASGGSLIVATDDDVVAPPGWLKALLTPFADSRVAVVTGNVLPADLETEAQQQFERYGGLGRGYVGWRADGDWFHQFRLRAVPTWTLGATANAAFRAELFQQCGLMDEALGAGTPTGCSEDTYVFYQALKAGHAIVYEPAAFVWHNHRRTLRSLRRQIYSYSKGHVAYHLTTLLRDSDARALWRLGVELPYGWAWRAVARLTGRSQYPIALLLIEIAGSAAGPFAWLRSLRRVRRLGRSQPAPAGGRAAWGLAGAPGETAVVPVVAHRQDE